MTRVYLFARLWVGYSAGFTGWDFNWVDDDSLGFLLRAIGATWIVQSGLSAEDPIGKWAQDLDARTKELRIQATKEAFDQIGHRCLMWRAGIEKFRAPKWHVFHVEESPEAARQVGTALVERMSFFHPISYKAVRDDAVSRTDVLGFERQLDNYPVGCTDEIEDIFDKTVSGIWKQLREEARAYSEIVKRLPPVSPVEPHDTEDADAQVPEHDAFSDPDVRGRFDSLEPRVQAAVRHFYLVCTQEKLDSRRPTRAHYEAAKQLAGEDIGTFETWKRYVNDGLMKLHGRAKERGPRDARSAVPIEETPSEE